MLSCSYCGVNNCKSNRSGELPTHCPTNNTGLQQQVRALYEDEESRNLAYHSALLDQYGNENKTRVEEIAEFAKACQYKHVGLAFCLGLLKEAKIFTDILRAHDLTVSSVICKNGRLTNEELNIPCKPEDQKKSLCNPVGQALFLNQEGTQLNVLLGLCVGHDSLFIKHSEAPVTILAVKDRITGHNPLAPIYLSDSFYSSLKKPKK